MPVTIQRRDLIAALGSAAANGKFPGKGAIHEATGFHQYYRRRGGMATRCSCRAAGDSDNRFSEFQIS